MPWAMGVEKVRFSESQLKMGDQKCIPSRRKSFIGHPSATVFQQDLRDRVFQQLWLLSTVTGFWELAALRGLGTSMQSALIVTCPAVFLLSPYAKTCERLSTHLKEEQMSARKNGNTLRRWPARLLNARLSSQVKAPLAHRKLDFLDVFCL